MSRATSARAVRTAEAPAAAPREGDRLLVAVLGGGQLGRMLGLAGLRLGMEFRFLDPDPRCPARAVGELVVGEYHDPAALRALADGASVVTFEFENVPATSLELLAASAPVAPPAASLAASQDRVEEKTLFERCGMATAPWRAVDDASQLDAALDAVGVPGVLKTRRLGYDGKGQRVVRDRSEARGALAALGGVPCIYEAFVSFSRELSIIAVRGADGTVDAWPIGENRHRDGILLHTLAPAAVDGPTAERLRAFASEVMRRLDHRGVLTIEFFDDHGRLLANEMAPRVHNSGHWTIDGAVTSQFENHLRAVTGLPLGSTEARGCSAMVNIVGRVPALDRLVADAETKVHLYGKSPRPGRKLGHATIVAGSAAEAARALRELEALLDADAAVPAPAGR